MCCRRDKTLNYFNVMLRKRLKNEEEGAAEMEEGETSKKKTSTKTDKSLVPIFYGWVYKFLIQSSIRLS